MKNDSLLYKYAFKVNKAFDENTGIGTAFNMFKPRPSAAFTQVMALGKTRNYSRVEKLHSIFRGY
jgi:hypothetical protein